MGRFNGAKAAQKRERTMKKEANKTEAHSQLKSNQQSLTLACALCRTPFMGNSSERALKEHSDNKHPKNTFKECFPTFGDDEEDEE